MATIKHLSSKNSNYAAAESYLTFQHNEYTGLPILDEKGRPKLRDSYLLDTLECGESSFAMACLIANRKYGKNGGREDVKTHHYIVSFDPKDAVENGLTMEWAQALGLQFCKENFPGHPAIVCTHPDGHNSAGNIHVHIVIGSLRVRTVERQPFMDKPCDWEAGKKHRCTSAMLRHLRVAVSPRRPCFGARVLGAAARTTPSRPCQRQTCRRRAAAHPDRLPDRAGQTAKADLLRAEQDHHLRGIFCIAHAGIRHRREGKPRPVELLPTRSDKGSFIPINLSLKIRCEFDTIDLQSFPHKERVQYRRRLK